MPVAHSTFDPGQGSVEHHFLITPDNTGLFLEQFKSILDNYQDTLAQNNIELESGVFGTFYLSDAANNETSIRESSEFQNIANNGPCLTIIQMSPGRHKIVFHAYHIVRDTPAKRKTIDLDNHASGVSLSTEDYEYVFLKNIQPKTQGTIESQTEAVFNPLIDFCKKNETPFENILRTWIYVADIDLNYCGMSDARNDIFDEIGINGQKYFPASTGIQARTKDCHDLILMDAFILNNAKPEQVRKMEALTHLNPTTEYGVRFERGMHIQFGDRTHSLISGTASISNTGDVLFKCDVVKQVERTLTNIDALLKDSGGSIDDMAYMIVYLRDISDFSVIEEYLSNNIKDTPYFIVQGHVCRPDWLIEIEGVAISSKGNDAFAPF